MQFLCPFCRGIVAVDNSDCGIDVQCGHCGEVATVPSSRVATGAVVGDFIILEEIGRGGMGVVYLAHQITLDRPAALKVLSEQYANNSEFVVGFIKEARAAAKLNHPHIVQAYAVGDDDGVYYFAMENIDGETMKSVLRREGKVEIEAACTIIQQIAEALDYAWKEQRLIHRDIKPDNIMLTRNGRAKLADLGLARIAGEIDDTEGDEVMGTPQYISPEHLTGAEMDVRSDIYSLGATFFNIVTGRFPYEGRSATEIARKHIEEAVPDPRDVAKIPDGVSEIIMKMMAKAPGDRYQSAEDLADDLRNVRRGKRPSGAGKTMSKRRSTATGTGHKTLILNKKRTQTGMHPVGGGTSTSMGMSASSSTSGTGLKISPTESIRRKKEKKAMTQIIIWIVLGFSVLALVGGFFVWKFTRPAESTPTIVEKPEQADDPGEDSSQQPADPDETEYTKAAEELLAYARDNPDKETDIMAKVDRFLEKYPTPHFSSEVAALNELMKVYVPIDEQLRVLKNRETARKRHLAELKKLQDAELAEQARIEREKRQAELEEQRKRLLEEQKEKERQFVEDYRKGLEERKDLMREDFIRYGINRRYDQAKAVFNSALTETERVGENLKPDAKAFADWAEKMQLQVATAKKLWATASSAGNAFVRIQVEVVKEDGGRRKRHYGYVTNVQNGQMTIKSGAETVTAPMSSLPIRQFKKLADETAEELLIERSATFHYMVVNGDFKDASERAVLMDQFWQDELRATILAYLKQRFISINRIADEDERRQQLRTLFLKYRDLPEFNEARRAAAGAN